MVDHQQQINYKHKRKPKDLGINHEVSKTIKDKEMEENFDVENMEFGVFEMEKIRW